MDNNNLQLIEKRLVTRFPDMFIRFGLILALASFCFTVFSPFVNMMLWALILAVALYPLHQYFARLLAGKQGLASVALVLMVVAFASGSLADGRLQLSDGMGRLALVAANVYVVFFNMSWGPVMWVMLGEMFPNQMRGSALAVAGFAQWIANFAISVSFPWMAASLGLVVTYGFYAVSALISFFLVQAWVKETRGRELEDMG